jgi:tight adherence protein B
VAAGGMVLVLAAAWRGGVARRRRVVVTRLLRSRARTPSSPARRVRLPFPAVPEAVVRGLDAAAVPFDAGIVWRAWVATVVVAVPAAGLAGGPGLALTLLAALLGGPVLLAWAFGDRSDRRVEAALPGVLESVAAGLRSGGSLRQAVDEAAQAAPGRLGDDLAAVRAELGRGEPLVGALESWAARRPLPGVRLAVAALALGAEAGGAHARAVDGVAATLRSRSALAAEVRALSSQARYSGLVIALAPVAFGVVAAATDGRTASFLFRTPLGVACLAAGLGLDAVAAVWMHRLTAVER